MKIFDSLLDNIDASLRQISQIGVFKFKRVLCQQCNWSPIGAQKQGLGSTVPISP